MWTKNVDGVIEWPQSIPINCFKSCCVLRAKSNRGLPTDKTKRRQECYRFSLSLNFFNFLCCLFFRAKVLSSIKERSNIKRIQSNTSDTAKQLRIQIGWHAQSNINNYWAFSVNASHLIMPKTLKQQVTSHASQSIVQEALITSPVIKHRKFLLTTFKLLIRLSYRIKFRYSVKFN